MGWGDLIAEEVGEAQTAMDSVDAAAKAIQQAINKVRPLLTSETWSGPDATAWIGQWQSLYAAVQSCLNSLPAAEATVVRNVRQSAEKMAREHAGSPAPN
ncbi:MAG TPA: hypothetical protein VH637_17185 [Streptosporangiaceae bacterium]|jgi:hypothetical protein